MSLEGGHIRHRSLGSVLLIYKRQNAEIYAESVPERLHGPDVEDSIM